EYLRQVQENNNPCIIKSFVQSSLLKVKLNNQNKIILPYFLYYDDFEVNNPLGSHAGIQKLGAVYISLACLPPELASSLNYIYLVALFKTEDKNCFGNRAIFKDLIAELNFLESTGIEVVVDNKTYNIFFKLGLILGDNLGLHSILGFVESFVANYHCRFCKTHKKECHQQSIQNDNSLRDTVNYTADVMCNDVSVTGIKEPCIWNDVGSFNVTTNYSVDIMHDMAEGVCKYDIGLILKEMIYNLKYFSLDTLNNRIESFNYEPVDIRSRPTLITDT
ncbi:uncharacterized protein LOC103311743, partial [Acyrthosiphon pisum]|uniref:Uncharacterized protein n=1 Tax=Acyrthosiphon pisum TaxID=7029 RepID=A0A8R2BAK0_ACYPI